MNTTMNTKRHRGLSASSASSESADVDSSPAKAARVSVRSVGSPIVCSLPPTCAARPTPLASSAEMEAHYAKYHAHVCEVDKCGCVFPDERFLELHFTECHDSLASARQARGDKIFQCFVPTCTVCFSNPKSRRLHLIDVHKFPKQYFFAVTNKGIGETLRKWGDGASMVRGDWKPREDGDDAPADAEAAGDSNDEIQEDFAPARTTSEDGDATVRPRNRNNRRGGRRKQRQPVDDDVDNLADTMSSLHLVPPAVRFGRGGRATGFVHPPHRYEHDAGHGGAHTGGSHPANQGYQSEMTVDTMETPRASTRGLPPQGGRGRGGARGTPIVRGRGGFARGPRGRGRAM